MRSKFFFKQSYYEAASLISDPALKAEFIMAVSDYGINGTVYQGDSEIIRVAMALIMPEIDKENRRYETSTSDCRVAIHSDRKDDMSDRNKSGKNGKHDSKNEIVENKSTINRDSNDYRDFRRWIKINAPNVYQRLCRKISNRDLESLYSRYNRQELQRKILLLERNGKVRNHLDELSIAIQAIEEALAA